MRISISILALLINFTLYSQQSNVIVNENNIWSTMEIHCFPGGNNYSTYHLKMEGDTIIESLVYKKLMLSDYEDLSSWELYGFFREENQNVYLRPPGYIEGLIYSFDVEEGDTVFVNNYYLNSDTLHFVVTEVDSVLLSDVYRKRISLYEYINDKDEVWVEGLGSYYGLTNSGNGSFGALCGSYYALCYNEDGTLMYQNPEYNTCHVEVTVGLSEQRLEEIRVYPNPATDKLNILLPEGLITNEDVYVELLTVSGEKITKKLLDKRENALYLQPVGAGFYLLKIYSNSKILSSQKILVD